MLVCGAFVNYKPSAAGLSVLNSVVNCYVVETCGFNIDSENNRVGSVLICVVNVRIRKLAGTCTDFIIFHVRTGGIIERIQPDYIISGELFRKSCGEVENISCAVTIIIEERRNFDWFEFVVTVYALAIFDGVLVVIFYVSTNKADTPLLFKAVAVVVSFAIYETTTNGTITILNTVTVCGNVLSSGLSAQSASIGYITVCCAGGLYSFGFGVLVSASVICFITDFKSGNSYLTAGSTTYVANTENNAVGIDTNNSIRFDCLIAQHQDAVFLRYVSNLYILNRRVIRCSNKEDRIFVLVNSPAGIGCIELTCVQSIRANGGARDRHDDAITQNEGLVAGCIYPTVSVCNFFDGRINYAISRNIGGIRSIGSSFFGSSLLGSFAIVRNDPTVLNLRCTVILTNDTVNGDGIAYNGLNLHLIETNRTVCAVSAINVNGIAIFIYEIQVTVGGVSDFLNNTCYIVLTCCVNVMLLRSTEFDSLFDCKSRTFGGHLGSVGSVGSSLLRSGFFGIYRSVGNSRSIATRNNKVQRELGNAGVIRGDVIDFGCTYRVIHIVSAKIIIDFVECVNPSITCAVITVNRVNVGTIYNTELSVLVLEEANVLLYTISNNVETVAFLCPYSIYSNCQSCIICGVQISAVRCTVKIQNLTKLVLIYNTVQGNIFFDVGIFFGSGSLGSGLFGSGLLRSGLLGSSLFGVCNDMLNDPTVFNLRCAIVVTNHTVNGDCIAHSGLNLQLIVTVRAVCRVSAVEGENVTLFIGNSHVTVSSIVNLCNNTGYIVLIFGIYVVFLGESQCNCLLNGKRFTKFGEDNCLANITYAIIFVADVTESGDLYLFNEDFATSNTENTFGKTVFDTGRFLSGNNCFCMSKCGNGFLRNQNFSTSGTHLTCGKTVLCTSGSDSNQVDYGIVFVIVTERCDNGCLGCITVCAIASLFAGILFGRSLGFNPFAKAMSGCGNFFLFYKNFATSRTLLALCNTGFGTSSFLAGKGLFGVPKRGNCLFFYQNFATSRTYRTFCYAVFGASGINCGGDDFGVTGRLDNFLLYKNFATSFALNACCQTVFGTGSINCGKFFFGVTGSRNFFCFASATFATVGDNTVFGAGNVSGNCAVIPSVVGFVKLFAARCTNVPVSGSIAVKLGACSVIVILGDRLCLFISTEALVNDFAFGLTSCFLYNSSLIKFVRNLTTVALAFGALVPVVELVVLHLTIFVSVFLNGNDFSLFVAKGVTVKFNVNTVLFFAFLLRSAIKYCALGVNSLCERSCVVLAAYILASDRNSCCCLIFCPVPCCDVVVTYSICNVVGVGNLTGRTCIGGITGLVASGRGNGCNVIVRNYFNLFGFVMFAICAIATLFTLCCTGGSCSNYPFAKGVINNLLIIIVVGVIAAFVLTSINGVATCGTGRRNGFNCYAAVTDRSGLLGLCTLTVRALVGDETCYGTSCLCFGEELVVVLDSRNDFFIGSVTNRTSILDQAVLGASCNLLNVGCVGVIERINKLNLLRVTATDTVLQCVALFGTSGCYDAFFKVVSVKFASFCGSQFGYGVVREVAGFKRYVTVVVGSGNGLYFALIVDEPNSDGVNVFSLCQFVRNGDGNFLTAEIGDEIVFGIGNGKVVDGVVANLFEFIGIQTIQNALLFICIQSTCANGNVVTGLAADTVCCFTKVDVCITNGKFGILQIVNLVGLIFGNNGYHLGLATGNTSVGSLVANNRAGCPSVTECSICRDSFLFCVATFCTSKNLNTLGGTCCSGLNCCSIFCVLFDCFANNVSTAIFTLIVFGINASFTFVENQFSTYTFDVVCNGSADRLGVKTLAIFTSIGVGCSCYTSSNGGTGKLVVVSDSVNALATSCTNLILGTSGRIDVPYVTCRSGFVANIGVTARTSVGGVTLLYTSGCSCNSGVVMTGCRNDLFFYSAARTSVFLTTVCCTGSSIGYCPIAKRVSERCLLITLVGVATSTGVNGRTHLGTGRRSHLLAIRVSKRGDANLCGCTALTGLRLFTCNSTGGSGDDITIGPSVTKSFTVVFLTDFTNCLLRTGSSTACTLVGYGTFTAVAAGAGMCAVAIGNPIIFVFELFARKEGFSALFIVALSAIGARIVVFFCAFAGCFFCKITQRVCVFIVAVRNSFAISHRATVADGFCDTSSYTADMTKCVTLGGTAQTADLCLGTGSILPIVCAESAVGVSAHVTLSLGGTSCCAAYVGKLIAFGDSANGAILFLSAGSIFPFVLCKLTIFGSAHSALCLFFASSSAAYVRKLFAFGNAANRTMLFLGAGSIFPFVVCKLTVFGSALGTFCKFLTSSSAANVGELVALGNSTNGAMLFLGAGGIYPCVITQLAVTFATNFTFCKRIASCFAALVTKSNGFITLVTVSARARIGGVSTFRARGRGYFGCISMRMFQRIAILKSIVAVDTDFTARAGLVIYSRALFGCRRLQGFIIDNFLVESMCKRISFSLVTNRTGLGSSTGCLFPSVACGINGSLFNLAALITGTRLLAFYCTSSGFLRRPFAPCVVALLRAAENVTCAKRSNTQHNHQQANDTS